MYKLKPHPLGHIASFRVAGHRRWFVFDTDWSILDDTAYINEDAAKNALADYHRIPADWMADDRPNKENMNGTN